MAEELTDLMLAADNLRDNGRVDQAMALYRQIAESVAEPAVQAKALHLAGVAAMGNVLDSQGTYYRDGLAFFNQAEQNYRKLNDRIGLGDLARDRAMLHDCAHESGEAKRWFDESVTLLTAQAAADHLGITYDKLGVHYLLQNDLGSAAHYIDEALKLIRQEPSAGFAHATALFDLARVEYKLNHFEAALDLAQESLSWFEADHGARRFERRRAQLHGLLSLIFYRLNHTKSAKRHGQLYTELIKNFDPLTQEFLNRELDQLA